MSSETYLRLLREMPQAMPQPIERERGQRLTRRALLYGDTVVAEFFLASVSLLCGLWVALPFDVFVLPFPVLTRIFNEPICGGWLICLGAARLAFLWQGNIKRRQWSAFFSFLTWLNLAAWVLLSDAQRIALLFFVMFALGSFWIFLRGPSRIDYRVAARKGHND